MIIKLPFGLQDGQLIDITSVESGLACNCACPCCEKPLIAKKGKIKQHHFAHHESEECQGAIETALHIYAKNILKKHTHIVLPPVYFINNLIFPATEVTYDNVLLEKRIENVIPDIIIYIKGKPLLIEISVTHFVDRNKAYKIRKLGYPAIEIDVKSLFNPIHYKVFGYQDFEKRLIEETDRKRWINNNKLNFIREQIKKLAIPKKVNEIEFSDNYLVFVNDCPINKRFWKSGYKQGKSYASLYEDCYSCPFGDIVYKDEQKEVHCFGHCKDEIDNIIMKFKESQNI